MRARLTKLLEMSSMKWREYIEPFLNVSAIYQEDRDRLGLNDAGILVTYGKMLQNKAQADQSAKVARGWHERQAEAAGEVNRINCMIAGTVECPRLVAALGSIAERFLKTSQAEGDKDTS